MAGIEQVRIGIRDPIVLEPKEPEPPIPIVPTLSLGEHYIYQVFLQQV